MGVEQEGNVLIKKGSVAHIDTHFKSEPTRYFLFKLQLPAMTSAPPAPAPNDSIVFLGSSEKTYKTIAEEIHDDNFSRVKLTGNGSIYYVYPDTNLCHHSTPVKVQVVTSRDYVPLTLIPPRSCKGFSREGIILFETFNFGGHSQNFVGTGSIEETFPVGVYNGVSSFRVCDGTWSLLNRDGGKIVVQEMTEFGPGVALDMPYPSDRVASIKRIR